MVSLAAKSYEPKLGVEGNTLSQGLQMQVGLHSMLLTSCTCFLQTSYTQNSATSFQLLDSSTLFGSCLYFLTLCLKLLVTAYCAFILFLSSWIIFTVITQNPLSGRLPIVTSLSCSSGVLSCSFVWNMFLCHLILLKFLCIFLHM